MFRQDRTGWSDAAQPMRKPRTTPRKMNAANSGSGCRRRKDAQTSHLGRRANPASQTSGSDGNGRGLSESADFNANRSLR